jgi:hypothetical protein
MHKGGQKLDNNKRQSSKAKEQIADPSVESIISNA